MTQPAAYILSSYSFITAQPIEHILDVGYQSNDGSPIPSFDENLLIELCSNAKHIFEKESNILDIKGDIIIVGDIHGSLHDLLRILKFIQENNSKALFLGDYVDRGNFSLECITLLFALKVMYPEKYYLIRGNHEFDAICSQYGFLDEIIDYHNPKKVKEDSSLSQLNEIINSDQFLFDDDDEDKIVENDTYISCNRCDIYYSNHNDMDCYKYSQKLYDAFIKAFSYLPISAIVNKTNFCIHGGLSPSLNTVSQIQKNICRPISDFEENKLLSDIVWSDPVNSSSFLFSDNTRGGGYFYNQKAALDFLKKNSLSRMIRAHECVKHGSQTHFLDKCITVFSASSYCSSRKNESGVLKLFQKGDCLEFVTFPPLPRLEKCEAVYYKVQPLHENSNKNHLYFSLRHPILASNLAVRLAKVKVKGQQCLTPHLISKQLFKTSSSKTDHLIQRPSMHHSNSWDLLKSKNNGNIVPQQEKIRNLFSLDDLPYFDENA